jgi:hypothetical protein
MDYSINVSGQHALSNTAPVGFVCIDEVKSRKYRGLTVYGCRSIDQATIESLALALKGLG